MVNYPTCKASCEAMNSATETGWTLATIPTEYHNQLLFEKISADFPDPLVKEKERYMWIGLL